MVTIRQILGVIFLLGATLSAPTISLADVLCANKTTGVIVTKNKCSKAENHIKKRSDLVGPAGPQGANGSQGATGPAGAGGVVTGKIIDFSSSCGQPDLGYFGEARILGTSYSSSLTTGGDFAIYHVLPGTYTVNISVNSNFSNPASFSYGSTSGSNVTQYQRTAVVTAGQTTDVGTITVKANCCGNYVKESSESCDAFQVGAATCASQGMTDGTLRCNTTCNGFDTSLCYLCGDNLVNQDFEVCDGSNLNSNSCSTQGFTSGTLACASDCLSFNTSGCS